MRIMSEKDKQKMLSQINVKDRERSKDVRKRLFGKKFLGDIIEEEQPKFVSNNLILAPVGSGKSHLIENSLIPESFTGKALYLTSNSALKDSVCPPSSAARRDLANKGESIKFYTTQNKSKYGNKSYEVHVMTYAEFGERVMPPHQTFTDNVEIIFCDEIHSLPIYFAYDNNYRLGSALNWILRKHEGKTIYYFTATKDSIENLDNKSDGYFNVVKTFDYLEHPNIRKYIANSTYYINHIDQLRPHLRAKIKSFNYYGNKALAFTRRISEQEKIEEIAREEGFKPLVLWSINNARKMSEEQLEARDIILRTGHIPEPYNILIINGAMQEGWNLYDESVKLAILDTIDKTEQIQALGRFRGDIDIVIKKTDEKDKLSFISLPDVYLNKELTAGEKRVICEELYLLDERGRIKMWPTIKRYLEKSGYSIEDKLVTRGEDRVRVSVIKVKGIDK